MMRRPYFTDSSAIYVSLNFWLVDVIEYDEIDLGEPRSTSGDDINLMSDEPFLWRSWDWWTQCGLVKIYDYDDIDLE